jgi:uncharacterized protein (TIGR03083 family)
VDVWAEVARRRVRLADEVEVLDPDVLAAPSWCTDWRVRDVLGHLVYLAEATQASVLRDVVRLGPKPDKALDRRARALGDRPVDELTSRLRASAGGRFHVLGSPAVVALGEVLVHGADMMRAVGRDTDVDAGVVSPILRVYRRVGRVAFHATPMKGVSLVATDAVVRLGTGPEVAGRSIDLLLLLANRPQVLAGLTGPGVDLLRSQPA